jgi:release factor glutamine methyltransferase
MTQNRSYRHWSPYEKTQLARAGLSHLLETVSDNTPVEYLTNEVSFDGWQAHVTPAVLIPRVETEELVELIFQSLKKTLLTSTQPLTIVDVGTGSGVIGLSLWRRAQGLPEVTGKTAFHLLDISPTALTIVKENSSRLTAQVAILESDLLSAWPRQTKIDFLIANLPYIPSARIATLPLAVKDFEPNLALDGGSTGMSLITELLEQALPVVTSQAEIWLEIDETHTLTQLEQTRPEYRYQLFQDSFGKNRFVKAQKI